MRVVTRGVFARNELPTGRLRPGAYVLNTHNAPGQHWILLYVDDGAVELYDSLARSPARYGLHEIDRSLPKRLQAEHSNTCGLYVLYFLYWRSRGITMDMLFHSLQKNAERSVKNHYLHLM